MPIPGYDSGTVAEFSHDPVGARFDVVAGVVPDDVALERSVSDPPVDVLSEPVDLVGLDGLKAVEAIRIELAYAPSRLPPGASPTDVAVVVDADGRWTPLESTVDLEETTVTAVLNDRPPGSTVVAAYDDDSSVV
ncbi:hypothetical protein [Natrarchaeobius oligotrophus]|uniref:Uncharacterized protein n=1 Tax=Natrarchaeobius chitinivorans TaxID=1679083 RepID=A0A3N6PIZ8_NATCH|nr:hypothetical protein [Natrarchaeobius chitinivorans]RQH00960.1 hypothetical protein EA472_10095 [Natrarchaeobius chitinivorans]